MAGRTRLVALEAREREEAMAKLTLWGGPDDAHRRCALFAAAPHPNPFPIVRRVQRGEERARLLGQALKVAVGTAIADRPPHRSRRALLTHRAPPSGSGVETVTWQWMQYPDRREEAVGGAGELLPAHECALAASFERLEPTPSHLVEVPPQARAVSGNGIVVQMPFEHPIQPRPGLGNGVVHSFAQLHLDLLELLQHPLLDRLAPDNERAPFA